MANNTKFVQTSAPIPPPPGGGSWRWDGTQWQERTGPDAAPFISAQAGEWWGNIATTTATDTHNTD
jgi:hypothetical protein